MKGSLAPAMLERLRCVMPSRDGQLSYYPCRVHLRDGSIHERVFMVDADLYARTWGVVPGRAIVDAEAVVALEEAPDRLPPLLANELYAAGESGMGYCVFTLVFADGTRQAYGMGNAVDFLEWPAGHGPADAVRALAHEGRDEPQLAGLRYEWCPVARLRTVLDA